MRFKMFVFVRLLCFLKKKKLFALFFKEEENKNCGSSVVYYGPVGKFILRDGIAKLLSQKVTF